MSYEDPPLLVLSGSVGGTALHAPAHTSFPATLLPGAPAPGEHPQQAQRGSVHTRRLCCHMRWAHCGIVAGMLLFTRFVLW